MTGHRLRLTVLGQELWCLQWGDCDCAEGDAEDAAVLGGGSAHDFERDTAPLDPADHYGEWEDRRRFGFGGTL